MDLYVDLIATFVIFQRNPDLALIPAIMFLILCVVGFTLVRFSCERHTTVVCIGPIVPSVLWLAYTGWEMHASRQNREMRPDMLIIPFVVYAASLAGITGFIFTVAQVLRENGAQDLR